MRAPNSREVPLTPRQGSPGATGVAAATGANRPPLHCAICLCSARQFHWNSAPATRAARAVTATVLSKLLNLREQPNANATVLAQLKARESLLVLEEADGWLHVQTCDRAQESDGDVAPVSVSLLALA